MPLYSYKTKWSVYFDVIKWHKNELIFNIFKSEWYIFNYNSFETIYNKLFISSCFKLQRLLILERPLRKSPARNRGESSCPSSAPPLHQHSKRHPNIAQCTLKISSTFYFGARLRLLRWRLRRSTVRRSASTWGRPTRAWPCGGTTAARSSPTTRATASRRPASRSPTPRSSSARRPWTRLPWTPPTPSSVRTSHRSLI